MPFSKFSSEVLEIFWHSFLKKNDFWLWDILSKVYLTKIDTIIIFYIFRVDSNDVICFGLTFVYLQRDIS